MEQCISRPPEKVLIMPNTSSSTERPAQRTPSVSSTKPARARSSLLSIISGGEKKSPKSSVSSSNEDPLSPSSCASPAVDPTPKSSVSSSNEDPLSPSSCASPAIDPTPKSSVSSSNEDPLSPSPCASPAGDSTPKSSVTSSNEDPLSPSSWASPAANLTPTSSPPQPLAPVSTESNSASVDTGKDKSAVKVNPTKKVPPPTLAKTFKRKSSSTATTPSPTGAQPPLIAKPGDAAPLQVISEAPDRALEKETAALNDQTSIGSISNATSTEQQICSVSADGSKSPTLELVVEGKDTVDSDNKSEAQPVVKNEEIVATLNTNAVVENSSATVTIVDGSSSQVPSVDVDLPPPVPLEFSPEIEDCDNMEFPPPPEMDFLPDIESAQTKEQPITDASEITEPTQSEDNSEVTDAVAKIISKYDVSQVALNNNNVQLHNNSVTIDADPAMSKQTSQTNELSSDSADIPSHNSNHVNAISKETTDNCQLPVSKEVDDLTAVSQILDIASEQLNLELCVTEELKQSADVSDKEPNISFEISNTERKDEPIAAASVDSSKDIDKSSMLTSDSDSIEHLISPPTLPPTSSFSALDTDDTPHGPNDSQEGCDTSVEKDGVASPTDVDMGSGEALTVAKHLDDSSGVSSTASPGTHSPPFNTSSESGDSGVESGIYSLVGETVTVKLRPTINDNKKPEGTVPMFERNSSELKRVTFREATHQTSPTVITTRKSAAELERIKRTGLSEDDVSQAELFYKGHMTEVMACPCLATLYFAESYTSENIPMENWKPEHIGIPVLIYDTGNGKRSRGLTIVFAEKGTGFLLWKTVINYESRYEVVQPEFHQLRIKGDMFAGIAFQDEASATSFNNYYKTCTADPEKNVLNNPNLRNGKKSKKDKKKSVKHKATPLPNKSAISKPCEFTHVTQLKQSEDGIMASAMVPNEDKEGSEEGSVKFK